MYKEKHNLVPKTMIDIFPISNSKYNLHNKYFSIPRVNTTKYSKHSIRYLGPYLWSKINIDLRQKMSLNLRIIGWELQLSSVPVLTETSDFSSF